MKFAIEEIRDWQDRKSATNIPVPSPRLRHRVASALDKKSFLEGGKRVSQEIRKLCLLVDRDIYSFESVLDFGCGAGRIISNFQDGPASCQFHGTDVDSELIDWCENNLPNIKWSTNEFQPPLIFPNNTFDLVYGMSVFTHLNEEYQHLWLSELHRVTKPGAILILTVHGKSFDDRLSSSQQGILNSKGFLHRIGVTGKLRLNKLPDLYQTTHHTQEYVRREWSAYFDIIHYIELGANTQDAIILRKPLL